MAVAEGHRVLVEESPIFIMGVCRSGTTLLSFMLDSHPNIAIGRETYLMDGVEHLFGDSGYCPSVRRGWYERYRLSREAFSAYVRTFIGELFSDYARKQNKGRWGDKSPANMRHCELMHELFPKAQFLHIVRDPRAVAHSRLRWKDPGLTLEGIAKEWQEENFRVENFGTRLPERRYLRIRYEDLVLCPEETMRRVLSFLGEGWHEGVLHHEEVVTARYVVCRHQGVTSPRTRIVEDKVVVEGGPENDPARKIDRASVDQWKGRMRKVHIARIQGIAKQGMRDYGYPFATGLIPLTGSVKVDPYLTS